MAYPRRKGAVHPESRMWYIRDDGDGGLELVITTSRGEQEVTPMDDREIARTLNRCAAHCEARFRKLARIAS